MSFTIDLTESQIQRLRDRAKSLNLTAEQLVVASVENLLADDCTQPTTMEFSDAMEYVLQKNRELYRRLA